MRPDGIICWYVSSRQSPPGLSMDPVKATGLVYAKRCGAKRTGPPLSRKARLVGSTRQRPRICAHRIRHWSQAERQWVCGNCGSPWRFWQRRQLRGEIQESGARGDVSEKRLQRLVDVGLALKRLLNGSHPWEALLYVEWANGISVRKIAERGARGDYGPGAPFTWGRTTVHRRIQAGGREWRAVLTEAKIRFDD